MLLHPPDARIGVADEKSASMTPRAIFAAISVAVVWGLTFIAIKIGVGETSPLMLSALRFAFAAFPAVFLVAPPKAPAWKSRSTAFCSASGSSAYCSLRSTRGSRSASPPSSSRRRSFFTIALARLLLGEQARRSQILGGLIAFAGMAVIGSARLAGARFQPFLLVVAAAFFWGSANVLAKTAGRVDMLAFTVWSSLPVPLFLLSLAVRGASPLTVLAHPIPKLALSVLVLAYAGTLFGFGLWARLLAHYSAAIVTPFALLVPIVGMIAGLAGVRRTLAAG